MPTDIFDEVAEPKGDVFDSLEQPEKTASPLTRAASDFTNPIRPPGSLPTMDDLHGAASDFLGLSKPSQPEIPLTADDISKLQDQLPKTGEERAARDYAAARAAGLGTGNAPAVPPDLIGGATKILGQGAAQALNIIPNAIHAAGRMTGSPRLAQAGQDLITEQGKPVPGARIISDAAKMAAKTFFSSKDINGMPTASDHLIAEGLSQSVKGATDSLLTPEGVATLPLLEAKVVRAIMAGDSSLKTPEAIQQTISVLQDPNATVEQKAKAIGDAGVNLAMTAGLAHSLGEHAPSLVSELRKEDINYQDAIKSPAYRDAIDQEAQWALDPNNDGVYRRIEPSGYQQPEEAATPVATTNPGGSQSDLSPEQQAISKNNSREAFEALQKKVDEEKASESTPETLKETEQDPSIQEAEPQTQVVDGQPQVADNGEIVGMGGAVQLEFGNSQQSATSIKNATVDAERAKRGLPPAMQPARKGFQEVWDRAMAKIDVDPASQDRLIDELQKHPRAITDEEDAMLLHRQVDLQNEYAKSTRNMAQAFDDGRMEALASEKIKAAQLSDQLQDLYKINKKAGTETARGLNARKMAAFEDFSLANMEMEARADRGGSRLNDSEMETLKKQHEEIVAAKKALDEYVAKQDARISELEAQKAIDKITRESAPKIHPKVLEYAEKFVKGLETAAESASKRILDRLSRTSAGLDPTLLSDLAIVGSAKLARGALELSKWTTELVAKFGDKIAPHVDEINKASKDELERQLSKQPKPVKDRVKKTLDATQKQAAIKESIGTRIKAGKTDSVTNLVQQLARSFVEQGIKGRDALIDAVHAVLKESDPEITRRETMDAISGYGDFKPLSKDQVSLELRDLKGQMQQVAKLEDIQAKQPIQKTGVERRAPSDEERRLIQQVNEAKRRHGVVVTDPARQLKSSLDAIKTNLRNRISDLEYQIAQGKKTVKTKTNGTLDAEATDLKAQRDALKEQFDAIFGKPEMTDGQRIAVAKNALEKSIAEYERRIKEGDLSAKKAVSKTPETHELQVLKAQRDALKAQIEELREAENPKRTPEQIANQSLRTRLTNRIAELEAKTAAGDFSPNTRKQITLDPESQKLKSKFEQTKQNFQDARFKARMSNRTFGEKFQDTFVKWGRASILSSPGVLLKLASAATERIGFTPLEEGAGSLVRRALPEIAAKAPREGGGFNVRIEAKAIADAVTKGMQDAWQTLTKGKSDLELNYGKHQVMPRTWLDFFGSVHGALKAPAKRAEFSRSFEKRVEFAIKNGADVSDPLVQTKLALDAYKDSQRSIFLQDNFIAGRVKRAINSFEEKSKLTGKTPAIGKATSTILRILLPIIKVPTNIVAETAQYSTGLATGLYRARASMKAGIENLHPDQADLIMRDLKKGSLGAAGLLLGFLAPDAIGGYYQHEEKRKAGDVKPGGARVAGIDIPSIVMHNPLLATVQIGSTVRRVMEKELKTGNDHVSAFGWGLLAGGVGLVEETPFVREMYEISKLLTPSERKQALANLLSSRLNPQFVQTSAAYFDKNDNGKPINRKPTGFGQRLEMGIPGLRQQVPVNQKKPEKD